MKVLCVIDPQADFITGSLGSEAAQAKIQNIVQKIEQFDGDTIIVTQDTHYDNYLETPEGIKLPVKHCIYGTPGWKIQSEIQEALSKRDPISLAKETFGSLDFTRYTKSLQSADIELIGYCTDICVVSNALILKTAFPKATVRVDPTCCAGTNVEAHEAALLVMKSCQVEIG